MFKITGIFRLTFLVLFLVLFAFGSAYTEESKTIDKQDVPAKVITAFEKAYPNAKIAAIESEEVEDRIFYEFEVKENDNVKDIIYLEDGTWSAMDEEISVKALPPAVVEALKRAYPKDEVDEAEKITREAEIEYEVVMEIDEGDNEMEFEIVITSDGKIVSTTPKQDKDEGDNDEDDGDEQDDDGSGQEDDD